MLKIVKNSNITSKKNASTSFSSATHVANPQPMRQFSLASLKQTAFVMKAVTKVNFYNTKPFAMNVRSFCEETGMEDSFQRGNRQGGFQRRPRGEGFQRRPPRDASHVVVIRGLNESKANEAEVRNMFPGAEIVADGVQVLKDSKGKSLGAVFVEFSSSEEATRALDAYRETQRATERDPESAGVAVRSSSPEEREAAAASASVPSTYVVLKRLPYAATEEEIKNIFTGLNVESVSVGNGSGVVKFATAEDAARALEKNGTEFARRPIVVTSGLEMDFKYSSARPPKIIRVRGAPVGATETDYRKFFDGLEITRFNATSREGIAGRIVPGDVFIEFATPEDAAKALKMDRQNMGDRYLQIYKSAHRERANRLNPNNARPGGFGNRGFGGFGQQQNNFGENQ